MRRDGAALFLRCSLVWLTGCELAPSVEERVLDAGDVDAGYDAGAQNADAGGIDAGASEDGGVNQVLFAQDFSSDTVGILDSHPGERQFARTTHNAPPGMTQSIRFNVKPGAVDSVTGIIGSSLQTADFVPPVDLAHHAAQTWAMKFRLDDVDWHTADPIGVNAKLMYLMPSNRVPAHGFYLAHSALGGASGRINVGDNGDGTEAWSGWEHRSYGWGNGSAAIVISGATRSPWGADGQWHTLRLQVDYENGGAGFSRVRFFIDDQLWSGSASVNSEGWFSLPPEFRLGAIRLFYADRTAASSATNRGGEACGIQWGDFKVLSGLY